MDTMLFLLLVALVITFLAWRHAERAKELARAREEAVAEPRWSYGLEPFETPRGRGYAVTTLDGERLSPETLSWKDDGIDVARLELASGAVDEELTPGTHLGLSVVEEPTPEVTAWDVAGTRELGRVSAAKAPAVAERLRTGELSDCVVLFETLEDGVRSGAWILMVHRDTAVEG